MARNDMRAVAYANVTDEDWVMADVPCVVLESSGRGIPDVYGIFNTRDEARQFIEWRLASDDLVGVEDMAIVDIVPATRHGLL